MVFPPFGFVSAGRYPCAARRASALRFPYGDEDRLVVLARAPPRPPVHMALEALDDRRPTRSKIAG